MDMSDATGAVKKYWPYLLGGAVGIFIIVKMNGSSSGGNYAADTNAAGQANAVLGLQSQALANQAAKDSMAGSIAFMAAQGEVAKGVGSAASGVITSLYGPSIAAINAGAAENAITINAAANLTAQGFAAQVGSLNAAAKAAEAYASSIALGQVAVGNAVQSSQNSLAQQSQGLAQQKAAAQSGTSIGQSIVKGVTAYYTGGASLAV